MRAISFCAMDPTAPTRSTSCPFSRVTAASMRCVRTAKGAGSGIPRLISSASAASAPLAIDATARAGLRRAPTLLAYLILRSRRKGILVGLSALNPATQKWTLTPPGQVSPVPDAVVRSSQISRGAGVRVGITASPVPPSCRPDMAVARTSRCDSCR